MLIIYNLLSYLLNKLKLYFFFVGMLLVYAVSSSTKASLSEGWLLPSETFPSNDGAGPWCARSQMNVSEIKINLPLIQLTDTDNTSSTAISRIKINTANWLVAGNTLYRCQINRNNPGSVIVNYIFDIEQAKLIPVPGLNGVYKTDIPGVGFKLLINGQVISQYPLVLFSESLNFFAGEKANIYEWNSGLSNHLINAFPQLELEFVKIGEIPSGIYAISHTLPNFRILFRSQHMVAPALNEFELSKVSFVGGQLEYTKATCKLNNMEVDLGKHSIFSFEKMSAIPFNIVLTDCSSFHGSHSVYQHQLSANGGVNQKISSVANILHYQVTPSHDTATSMDGHEVVLLSSHTNAQGTEPAEGIGILIYQKGELPGSLKYNTPVESKLQLNATERGSYVIPMLAKYVRLMGKKVTAGHGESSVIITVSYQ